MGKYDNVTMKEYMKKKKEMLDDLGRTKGVCGGINCKICPLNLEKDEVSCSEMELVNPDKALEIVMEYEHKVDWSKVEVDTKVLVRNFNDEIWFPRYFAEYKNDNIYCFDYGRTSFTKEDTGLVIWKYAKLYKGDE